MLQLRDLSLNFGIIKAYEERETSERFLCTFQLLSLTLYFTYRGINKMVINEIGVSICYDLLGIYLWF